MTNYTGYSESLNKVLNELEALKNAATLLSNDIARHECLRHKSRGCADAYAYCQQLLIREME